VPWQSDIDIQSERFESQYGVELLVYGPTPDFPEVPRFVEQLRDRVLNKGTREAKPEIEAAKLERITLENIGPFESLALSFEQPWNVLLGNNGSGKSTLLKAIALGLCGDDPKAAEAGAALLRSNSPKGAIVLRIGGTDFTTTLARDGEKVTVRSSVTPLQAGRWAVLGFPSLRGASLQNPRGPSQGATTAYPDVKDLLPLVHSQVDYRMDNVKQWLVNVHTWAQADKPEEAEHSARYAALRDAFFKILGALTPGVSVAFAGIAKDTFQILVQTQDGIVPIDHVSQGTSSVFGWIGALLQRMYEIYGDQPGVEAKPALVLVDEIDAHMHPDWQRKIVPLIKSLFPNLQVFATTHSPLIIGSMENNEIYHLRRSDKMVSVERLGFSPKGWRADQILTSSGFELPTTVSPEGVKLKESYAEALAKASDPANKNDPAVKEHYEKMAQEISEAVPSHPETAEERLALEMLEQFMIERFMQQPDEARDKVIQQAQGILTRINSGGTSDESNQV